MTRIDKTEFIQQNLTKNLQEINKKDSKSISAWNDVQSGTIDEEMLDGFVQSTKTTEQKQKTATKPEVSALVVRSSIGKSDRFAVRTADASKTEFSNGKVIEYDNEGDKVCEKVQKGDDTEATYFDVYGNKIYKTVLDKNGIKNYEIYGKDGQPIDKEKYNLNCSLKGNKLSIVDIAEYGLREDGSKYISKHCQYDENTGMLSRVAEFDDMGRKTKQTEYDSDGKVAVVRSYEYSSDGAKITSYNVDGDLKVVSELDSSGKRIRETRIRDASKMELIKNPITQTWVNTPVEQIIEYNSDGNITNAIQRMPLGSSDIDIENGTFNFHTTKDYKVCYDENGKMLSMISGGHSIISGESSASDRTVAMQNLRHEMDEYGDGRFKTIIPSEDAFKCSL